MFSFFHFHHHFFGLKIIIPFLYPLRFFIVFSFLFFLPLAFSFFFPLLRKWSLVLWDCHKELFLEPFSFLFILFRVCIVMVISRSFDLKNVLGNYQKELFLEPFSFFFVFVSFWICFLPLPSKLKLSKGTFSRTLFVFPHLPGEGC